MSINMNTLKTGGWLLLLALAVTQTACNDDFMDRTPLDALSPQTYFKTESELSSYITGLYSYIPSTSIYTDDQTSDNIDQKVQNLTVAGQITVPTTGGGWSFTFLRSVNFYLENSKKANVAPEVAAHYAGIARLFRAWFYHDMVKRFGDVPWYGNTLEPGDTAIFKPRDPRNVVMDSVLADLNYAVANIRDIGSIEQIDKWAALALKARITLHEGTYRRYHGIDDGQAWLREAAGAARQVIDSHLFKLYTTGHPTTDYRDLFLQDPANPSEVILSRAFDKTQGIVHNTNANALTGTLGTPSVTKSLVDTYLMRDGTPFTSLPGHDTLAFYEETQNRDPRLAQTLRTPGYTRIDKPTVVLAPDFNVSGTGYQPIKFVTGTSSDAFDNGQNDLPVIRYGEVLLIYAEAKAELGELTQADLDISINLLRDRVGMPHMNLATLTVDAVLAADYPNVGGAQAAAILEIRRERRVELVLEGRRYDDLMRWKAGPLLARPFQGMYFPHTGDIDMDHNGMIDISIVQTDPPSRAPGVQYLLLGSVFTLTGGDHGKVVMHPNVIKVFDENKNYLFPIPSTELVLNPKLVQNPGW